MKIHTPIFLYNTSIDFFNLAEKRCQEIFTSDYQNDTSLFLKISAPAMMLSFSVELILKSLLLKRLDEYPKIHSLYELYGKVPDEDKNGIELQFGSFTMDRCNYPTLRFVVDGYEGPVSKIQFESVPEEINHRLSEHDNSFVHWRYISSFSVDTEDKVRHFDFSFMCKFYNSLSRHSKASIK